MKAYLYTWGRGRTTAEGEHIPTRIEQMEIHHIDGMLVHTLPIPFHFMSDKTVPLFETDSPTSEEVYAAPIISKAAALGACIILVSCKLTIGVSSIVLCF